MMGALLRQLLRWVLQDRVKHATSDKRSKMRYLEGKSPLPCKEKGAQGQEETNASRRKPNIRKQTDIQTGKQAHRPGELIENYRKID